MCAARTLPRGIGREVYKLDKTSKKCGADLKNEQKIKGILPLFTPPHSCQMYASVSKAMQTFFSH